MLIYYKIRELRRTIEEKRRLIRESDCDQTEERKRLREELRDLKEEIGKLRRESGTRLNPDWPQPLPVAMQQLKEDLVELLDEEDEARRDHREHINRATVHIGDLFIKICQYTGYFVDDWGTYPEGWNMGITEPMYWHIYGAGGDAVVEFIPCKGQKRPDIKARKEYIVT